MERMISADEGRKLAEDWNAIFLEASAKQNTVSYFYFNHSLLLINRMLKLLLIYSVQKIGQCD